MDKISRRNLIALPMTAALLVGFMFVFAPSSGTGAVFVWFSLVAATSYFSLGSLSELFSLQWSPIRLVLYTIAALSLIGLSTLNQLTVLDVAAVFLLTGLAQLAYQLRSKGK